MIRTKQYSEAEVAQIRIKEYKKGVSHASEIADTYNGSTSHPYRLGDCIRLKLNQNKKPRKNNKKM